MKLLITGGAGFIGSNFVHYWIRNHPSDDIIVLDKLTYAGNLENLNDIINKISFIRGDICNHEDVEKAMAERDIVVHFAAETHVDRSIKDSEIFVRTNVLGTQVLLEAAKNNKIKRFHHISTDEVFGSLPLGSKEKWNEKTPYNPRNPYSASKAASDHLVRSYYYTHRLPITISNCSNNIGAVMYTEKLIPLAVSNLLDGRKIPVYKPGNQVREWLNVKDHCAAIDLILQKGKIGETYFISPDNEELTNLQVIKKLLVIMGKSEDMIEYVADRPGHDQRYAMSHEKISNELGWQPKYKLDETLKEMIEWYKAKKI
jgi:dTDP-glucose 4,6-dehydratase